MTRPIDVGNGDVVDADHVVTVMYEPWQKADGYTKSHRVVLVLDSGASLEYDYDTRDEAVAARDALIAKVR